MDPKYGSAPKIYLDKDLFLERVKTIASPKVEFCATYIPVSGTWVDIGCGTGELLMAVKQRGWTVRGYEADDEEIEFAQGLGLDIVNQYVQSDTQMDWSNIHVVSLVNVIEHISNPVAFLQNISAQMPAESSIVIEVPRHPSLSSFVNLMFPHLAYRHIYSPNHLHVFTETSMARLLEQCGFSPVAIWTFGQDIQELLFACATSHKADDTRLFDRLLDASGLMQAGVDKAGFSDVLLIVAKKASR